VLIGVALYEAYHHVVEASFMKRMRPAASTPGAIEASAGSATRPARSCWRSRASSSSSPPSQYDPNESKGISGSLQELAEHSWGRIVLWATAIGLFLFGLFCLAESRYRKHS
jgi:hypothetical protein